MSSQPAIVALEDGTTFEGFSFGHEGEQHGEIVFNTSMTGYQEILTDPSYKGQIVTMTYPLIGNYGINDEDVESDRIYLEGFLIKELSRITSNYRSRKSLEDYLKENRVIGIEGIDTRALTRHLRVQGAMKGFISTVNTDKSRAVRRAKESPGLVGVDLAIEVTCKESYQWLVEGNVEKTCNVVAIDCGIKFNILRLLITHGCNVTVVPSRTGADEIRALNPDGVFVSNGPGDPAAVENVPEMISALMKDIPVFGICLGHQMLGLALGGKTYKLKFGHRGVNHPVMDLATSKVAITTQNHGFCVDAGSLDKDRIEVTHLNLNDHTVEGIRHKEYPVFSVQYHPEASAGPHDSIYLFQRFIDLMEKRKW